MNRSTPRKRSASVRRFMGLARLDEGSFEKAAEIIVSGMLQGVTCPPTDLREVASRLGVRDLIEESLPMAGELRKDDGAYVIAYSREMPFTRQRFTVAHELGHVLIEQTGRGAPRVGAELERICDAFAGELLAPTQRARAFLGATPSLDTVLDFFRAFRISRQAGALRVSRLLGLEFVEFDKEGRISFRTRGLPHVDWQFDHVVRELRERDSTAGSTQLARNRVWNGVWDYEGARVGRQDRALVMFRPVVPDP